MAETIEDIKIKTADIARNPYPEQRAKQALQVILKLINLFENNFPKPEQSDHSDDLDAHNLIWILTLTVNWFGSLKNEKDCWDLLIIILFDLKQKAHERVSETTMEWITQILLARVGEQSIPVSNRNKFQFHFHNLLTFRRSGYSLSTFIDSSREQLEENPSSAQDPNEEDSDDDVFLFEP